MKLNHINFINQLNQPIYSYLIDTLDVKPMNEHPKEQAQTRWLNRSQPFSIDTHPNLRQATFQRIHR